MRPLALFIAVLPGFVRLFILRRFCHADIAEGVTIGFGTVILAHTIRIGKNARIGRLSYIRVDELVMGRKAAIGSLCVISAGSVRLGNRATIGSQVTVSGERDHNGLLEMGMYSWIFQYCYVNVSRPIRLGKNVGIGGGSYIFTHGYWLPKLDGFPVNYGDVQIDDDTWLPWGCFVMPGVHIGRHVVVGARSVITKSVPSGALVAGTPAKVIREKSNVELSIDQKYEIFKDLIGDYARKLSVSLSEDAAQGSNVFRLGDSLSIALHSDADQASGLDVTLHVYWCMVPEEQMFMRPTWSLANYESSPEEMLPSAARDFLLHARTIGLRFYPVDEK